MNQLILDGLSKAFRINGRTHQAVHPFECSLGAGEIAIVGESGSVCHRADGGGACDTRPEPHQRRFHIQTPQLTDAMVFQDPFASQLVHRAHTARTIRL